MERNVLGFGQAFVVLFVLGMTPDALAGTVQPHLLLGESDVSKTIDARVVFSPLPGTDGAPIECLPFRPCPIPIGRFEIDLESPTHVALSRPTFVSDTEPGGLPHAFALPVFPAAFVELGRGRYPGGAVLTVLDIETGLPFKSVIGPTGTSVRAPARKVVAGVFREGKILELWRPISPKGGQRLELPETTPLAKGKGQLVVSLLFPASGTSGGNKSVNVRRKSENGANPPDLAVIGDPWRWTGFWFDLPAGDGTLEVVSEGWTLAASSAASVPDRGAGFFRELKLIPRPRLKARFEENGRLPSGQAEVDLLDCRRLSGLTGAPQYSLCTQASNLKQGVGSDFLFEGLDPVLYALRWKAGSFRDFHMVNLSDGKSQDVTIPVAIHLVKGKVTRRGHPGSDTRMTWRHFSTEIDTQAVTDEEGRYEVLLAPSGQYAVFFEGPDFQRHAEIAEVYEDREADFEVPANSTTARVLDAERGQPIPGAFVNWHLEAKGQAQLARGERVSCDDTGRARFPPFPPGQVIISAKARGYRVSEERRLEIAKDSGSAELEFRLVKGVETAVRLLDGNGNPSKGAWAQLPSGVRTVPADDTGETYFEVLLKPGDPVFAMSAAGSVVLARFAGEDTPIRIGMPSRPFSVRFLTADGRPAAQEWIQYSIDGIRVPQPMDYLARKSAGGDVTSRRDGSLVVAGLPSSGTVSLWPQRKPDAVVTRPLPVVETIELPAP